jgi:hypothetical protein
MHTRTESRRRRREDRVSTPSGWYPDTTRPNTERYWDGRAWTEQARFPGVKPFESPVPTELADPALTAEGLVPMFATPSTEAGALQSHRPRRPVVIKALSLLLAVVLVGGGAFLLFGRHTDADAAVADAVNSALGSRSADFTVSGSGSAAGQSFTLSGNGAIDFTQNDMQMSLTVSNGSQQVTEQAVYLNKVIYLNLGNAVSQIIPGKSWLSLDLSQLSQDGAAQSLGSGSSLGNDPAAALQALAQDGNKATDLGSSTIDGVTVEGYAVHLDAATLKAEIAKENLPSWMQDAVASVSNPNVDYKVYVDASGRVVRMTTDTSETVSGLSVNEGFSMDFSNYGASVNVSAPPAGDVESFQSFLQQAAGSLSGSSTTTN